MKSYSKISKRHNSQEAASNPTSTNSRNTFQLVDNRIPTSTSTLTNSNISTTQLKSNQAIANYNSNVVQLTKFNKEQRARKLAANKKKNDGFHTCDHCGFQHSLVHYATFQNRRMGDGQFHIDHIQPASRGGRNNMRNGRVLCGTCNTSRGNRAHVGATGFKKYHALHRKLAAKNYMRRPSKKRR
ncbi:HNH endonuclease [Flavobacterium tyrosinilyticum]|uniref:HNH endonuclease n=1 Tax=Flavobacterium tyrosinilyticum TaxID=1658740 RepID=UPI00202EF1DB|nr:HNH endonuclease [Flavobacterium tyrosinilyticum]MCM0668913.1 HNH endonuclease [Flavobacterium tyrosinilyticum]